jgi:hypothetical protein
LFRSRLLGGRVGQGAALDATGHLGGPLMILVPGLLYVPVYFLLRRFMPKPVCA